MRREAGLHGHPIAQRLAPRSLRLTPRPRLERVRHGEVLAGRPPRHSLAGVLVQLAGDDVEGLGVGGRWVTACASWIDTVFGQKISHILKRHGISNN